ncbi:MAG TPA: homocysteine S-methyltransferase family protein [Gammaproteobacteria bacterium]|nr:homocysteine S-methyltransferase family protein [Gammaproteobacteria bacterium]
MEQSWLTRLEDDDIVLLDGGTASELRRRGVALDRDAWSAPAAQTHRELLERVHRDYIEAGADVITTNTFATSRFVLEAAGLGDELMAINRAAVDATMAARDAAPRRVAVAGSISCLPPRFDPRAYPPRAAERAAYQELAGLLADRGVDLIALEMIEDAEHGTLAMAAALETGLPVWLGISVRCQGEGVVAYDDPDHRLEIWLGPLLAMQPTVVNVMHTRPSDVGQTLAAIRRDWNGPIGVYPELETPDGGVEVDGGGLVDSACGWVAQGARLLGGCCGAGPEHVAALAAARSRLLAARL